MRMWLVWCSPPDTSRDQSLCRDGVKFNSGSGPHWSCFQLAWSLGSDVCKCSGDGYFPSFPATSDGEDRGIISGRVGIVSRLSCLPHFANLSDFAASVSVGLRKTQN